MKYDVRHSNFAQATGLTSHETDKVGAYTQICPYVATSPIRIFAHGSYGLARLLCLTMLSLVLAAPGFAQQRGGRQPQLQPPATGGSPQVAGSNSFEGTLADTNKDYLISPGDVLEIWVEDSPELS